jgi:uncharacterized protein YneF (UPF0154 family)
VMLWIVLVLLGAVILGTWIRKKADEARKQ